MGMTSDGDERGRLEANLREAAVALRWAMRLCFMESTMTDEEVCALVNEVLHKAASGSARVFVIAPVTSAP